MDSINVYAQSVTTSGEGDQVCVFLNTVDASQVVKEFNSTAVLDALDWSDIISYVTDKQSEDSDE